MSYLERVASVCFRDVGGQGASSRTWIFTVDTVGVFYRQAKPICINTI